jgi:hypothetical protein
LASVSFLVLFVGFRWNAWRAADQFSFALTQQDTEALVVGRMVWSRERGLLASAGLLGFVEAGEGIVTFDTSDLWEARSFDFQRQAYLERRPIRSFSPYFSHCGLQGLGFAAVDAVLWFTSPAFKMGFFHTLTAALVAAAYSLLVLWLRREFGVGAAFLALLVVAASPWLTALARNMYWSLWLFLLPALGIGAALSTASGRSDRNRRLAFAAFLTLFVRFLSGYEFVTITAAMGAAPLLYYAIRETWTLRLLFRRLGVVAAAGLAALITSLAVLTLQVSFVTGSPRHMAKHVSFAIGRRTSGEPSDFPRTYAAALSAKTSDVLKAYVADRFDRRDGQERPAFLRWLLFRRYGELIAWILLAAGWAAARTRWIPAHRRFRPIALIAATLCALLGVLAWLVVFKAHSYNHLHVNPVMWHLFFLPLGAALVFFALGDAALLLGRMLGLVSATHRNP